MDNSHDIDVLNSLVTTTLDSMKGYREAADDSVNSTHSQFFREMAEERSRVASELQERVRSLGGEPATESGTGAGMHRAWLDFRNLVVGGDEKAIVAEVERGEDYIRDKFEDAIADDELSAGTRGALEKCFASIRKGHDRVSEMKHATAD